MKKVCDGDMISNRRRTITISKKEKKKKTKKQKKKTLKIKKKKKTKKKKEKVQKKGKKQLESKGNEEMKQKKEIKINNIPIFEDEDTSAMKDKLKRWFVEAPVQAYVLTISVGSILGLLAITILFYLGLCCFGCSRRIIKSFNK